MTDDMIPRAETTFQARVAPWMQACFGERISADRLERGDRLLEEVFELLQSGDYPRERITSLVSYVWSRPVGQAEQEVGGVMVTLAAYCLAHNLDMHEAAETELARVWTKVEVIRAKQAAKPKGSALPQQWPEVDMIPRADAEAMQAAAYEAAAGAAAGEVAAHGASCLSPFMRRAIRALTPADARADARAALDRLIADKATWR